ncbi:two-component regulator propeller domain-containing protein [Bacteroides sp. 519]|uniref:two-component regulator propeller domain-containing protein n=1 Tax=Bacteroides sp. 519 TaxID=2302937 RepID=UPI0013D4C86C|nr:two-component regulator propeller domain-containing protein [Bacteroides sp. 519]NDV60495.1 response regulator [Bacteroides sp. 519]
MKRISIFFLYCIFTLTSQAIFFKHIGTNEGLAQLSVMSIYQDELGRMWFGTYEGISIYNGNRITNLKPVINPDHYPDLSGKVKASNTLIITGNNMNNLFFRVDYALVKYNIKTDEIQLLVPDRVNTVASVDGEIWYSRNDSIFRWNDEANTAELILKTGLKSPITKIHRATNKTLWIGTSYGFYKKTNTDQHPVLVIPAKDIAEIYETSSGDIWIGCRMDGMHKIDKNGQITEFLHQPGNPNSIASNQIRAFLEDKKGNLWIGTFNGLQKYEPETGKFTLYSPSKQPGSLNHASVFSLYQDKQGTIWVGTYYGGVNYFNPDSDIFTYYTDDPLRSDCLSHVFVGNMVEDKNHDIWICTEGGGLNKLDRKTKSFTHFMANRTPNSIAHNNIKAIVYDQKRHSLYIGTHTGGISKYDISRNQFTNYLSVWKHTPNTPGDIIHSMQIVGDSLLITARNGLFVMNMANDSVKYLFKEKIINGLSILVDKDKKLWISQTDRLLQIDLKNEANVKTYRFGEKGLGSFQIMKMLQTANGDIYFAGRGSGVSRFNPETDTFERFTVENGALMSNYCYNIAESRQGNLVLTTDNGLSFFLPQKGTFEHVSLGTNGLIVSAFNEGCGLLVGDNGEIFAGGTDGLTTFFEDDLFNINKDYNIFFSQLQISNKVITPNDKSGILKKALAYTDKITLSHKQNNLIISFTSNNYIGMLDNYIYEYKLEGFDANWISTFKDNIYYTNLNPGDYVLKVRQKEINQSKSIREISMAIHIKTPFYATPISIVLYILLVLLIISTLVYFQYSKIKLKTSLDLEKKDKEQIEILNQAKLRFFTNISHEFRTPLTLIISQVEVLLQNSSLSPTIYNKILKIYKHTYQMRRLISELLDFRKFEQNHVVLNLVEKDFASFVQEIYLNFYEFSAAHHITYTFQSKAEKVLAWFDPIQMQKVVYNLLSNAFKYTKAQGFIEVIVVEKQDTIDLQIIDNGIGINQKDIEKIFDRFYQAGNEPENLPGNGTGIGLALTKSIVESHHGTISVKSQPGYGSIFTVTLKKGNEHFANDKGASIATDSAIENIKPDTLPDPFFMDTMTESLETSINDDIKEEKNIILIVEDNEELLQTLIALFSPLYQVVSARNGEEGLQKAIDEHPDLILSDIMMPRMTGTEMCMRIKSNIDLCHIPVVLLTALTSSEQNMEGLQRGADDYIGKPFNAKLLIARCNNLIRNRKLLQNKYKQQTTTDTKLLATNKLDLNFIEKAESIIIEYLDDPEFDINQLAQEMALGRSTLFSKFKSLTGMTPNEFILNYKLKLAANLLQNEPDLQISDISDRLGFSSPRYFSKCFKIQFNITPVQFRKRD